jgi:hypothetical protein
MDAIHRLSNINAKMKKRTFLCLGLVTLFLVSCSPSGLKAQPDQTVAPQSKPIPSGIPATAAHILDKTAVPSPSPQPDTPIVPSQNQYTKYILSADFDYRAHTLDVRETLRYINKTDSQITTLPLIVDPNRKKNVFRLDEITWADGSPISDYTLQKGTLIVSLFHPLQPDETVELRLKYHLDIPFVAGTFGATNRQVNLANWYAFVPAYHAGPGWLIHEPGRVGEPFAYDVADYDVTIRLIGKETAITLAAGVSAEVLGNEYHYRHDAARNFSWSASTEYVMVWSRAGNIVITGYVFPEHEQTGLLAAGFVSEAVLLFNDLFGTIPQSSVSFVEADFPDGMEYEGIYFLDQVYFTPHSRSAKSGLATLSVHETAHQWWGGLVANDQGMEPWLDEALCTFSELLFYEQSYPRLVSWWWDYRVDSFKPSGRVNATIYQFKDFRTYVNAVYLRGARFMNAIRKKIGEEAFLTFLREYAHTYAYRLVMSDDFFSLLGRFSSIDLSDLRIEYFKP